MISRFKYPATRAFYKRLDRYLTKIRRVNPDAHKKFIDPTRIFAMPPLAFPKIEMWVEKETIRNFLGKLARKYRLSIQVLRGFASLSMYRKALERARKRKVDLILYVGDFDPSGLLIDEVAREEMNGTTGIMIKRIVLTLDQVKRFRPPPRSVSMRDSRAKDYIARYGDRCWEFEALRPRTALRLVETELRKAVPPEFLKMAEAREKAAVVARPITERLRKMIEREASKMLATGIPEGEILRLLSEKYKVRIRRRRIRK